MSEFEVSLVYTLGFRAARTIKRSYLKTKEEKEKEEKEEES